MYANDRFLHTKLKEEYSIDRKQRKGDERKWDSSFDGFQASSLAMQEIMQLRAAALSISLH